MFTFDSHKHPSNVDKCVAFWKTVASRDDIKPVDCTLKTGSSCESVSENVSKSSQADSSSASGDISWFDILMELQKRNLDKVAVNKYVLTC